MERIFSAEAAGGHEVETEHVTVRAEPPMVDRKDTSGRLLIARAQVDQLPVAGRVITDLALLDSSVSVAATTRTDCPATGRRGETMMPRAMSLP